MSVIDEAFDHLVETGVADPVVDLVLAAVDGAESLEAAGWGAAATRPAPTPGGPIGMGRTMILAPDASSNPTPC